MQQEHPIVERYRSLRENIYFYDGRAEISVRDITDHDYTYKPPAGQGHYVTLEQRDGKVWCGDILVDASPPPPRRLKAGRNVGPTFVASRYAE